MLKLQSTEDIGLPEELLTAYYAMRSAYAPGVVAKLIEDGAAVADFLEPIVYEGGLPAAQDYVKAITSQGVQVLEMLRSLATPVRPPRRFKRRARGHCTMAQ
ncbi:MAG: hypothetical protein ACRYGK_11255 [Janthinobacterium lividum]